MATVRSIVQPTKGLSGGGRGAGRGDMNNAESLTVRLIIGHCGHWDGSMLSGTILNDLDHHCGTIDTVCRQQVHPHSSSSLTLY